MRIVFWLDPDVGFDWNTPEIITNFADGLAGMGYDVELLVQSQVLDAFPVEQAVRRVWFEDTDQQIMTDVLISNRLEWLLRDDMYQAGERVWIALGNELNTAIHQFETYQLKDEIQVLTLTRQRKEKLEEIGIPAVFVRPGIRFEKCKGKAGKERENPYITIGLFDSRPDIVRLVLQGVEMTRVAMSKLDVQLFTDQEMEVKVNLPIRVKVKPTLEERIQAYQRSDIVIYIPGQEKISLIPLEAMAAGVPVILPQHPALAEYEKNHQNSIMLGKLHPKGLALAILNIMKIGNIREQLKTQGVKTAQEYDLQQSLHSLEQLWNTPAMAMMESPVEEEPEGEDKEVDVVLLNYQSSEAMLECLTTLRENTNHPYRVIVVGKADGEEALKLSRQEPGISIIQNQQNNGMARTFNQGILAGKGKYILLAPIPIKFSTGWLEPLLMEMQKSEVAMVYPQELKVDREEHDEHELNPMSANSIFMIKREFLNKLGLMDEAYTLSYTDLDYSLRVEEKGYQVVHCLDSIIYSSDFTDEMTEEKVEQHRKELVQNRRYLGDKWGDLTGDVRLERQGDGVIIFSLLPWQRRAQRTEALIEFLHQQGQQVVYVEPYCANRPAEQLSTGQYLYTCKGNGTIYYNISNTSRRVEMTHDLKVQLALWGIHTPVLWIEAAWWEPLIKHFEHRLMVYITPEILLGEELETFQQIKEKCSKAETALLKAVDVVVVASEKRKTELEHQHSNICYIPGGFFPMDLDRYIKGYYTLPDEMTMLGGYKVGITGTFNRFFPKYLLRDLARKHPEVSFIFVGEITCELGELAQIANLHFLGNKGWDYLLDCLYFCDVLLYPYQSRGLMAYIDPYIINYYLALGKPIVAFKHPEVARFAKVIACAESDEDFMEMFSHTLAHLEEERSEEKIRLRLAHVRGHSWEDVMAEIHDMIATVLPIPKIVDLSIPVQESSFNEKENPLTSLWKQIQKRLGRK